MIATLAELQPKELPAKEDIFGEHRAEEPDRRRSAETTLLPIAEFGPEKPVEIATLVEEIWQ